MEPIDQDAVVGHGVSIACQAEGFPIPTVTWKQSIGKSRLLKGGISMRENSLSLFPQQRTRNVLRLRCSARNEDIFASLKALSKHKMFDTSTVLFFTSSNRSSEQSSNPFFFTIIRTSLCESSIL